MKNEACPVQTVKDRSSSVVIPNSGIIVITVKLEFKVNKMRKCRWGLSESARGI